ncbi:transposase [Candidatus Bathyarchaeota archaeon]|nr:transposase [Candidatus Bathyarchaeota archaeon]
MILTFKVRHGRDLSAELRKARQIAEFALKTKALSSRDVKQFGLKSAIANQILRKYSRNKVLKRVDSVKLTVPHQSIAVADGKDEIKIPCLKLNIPVSFRKDFEKVNQVELDGEFAFVSITIPEGPMKEVSNWIGVDRNATGHVAVVADPNSGKVWKLGKTAQHIHKKYVAIRKELQRAGKYKKAKSIRNRESRIVRDINHKISKKIVDIAEQSNSGIKLERLGGIRKSRKRGRRFNGTLHSWSFYQLQSFLEYKAKLRGIPVVFVEPRNTSKECSRCGSEGTRQGKRFVCPQGHVDHADANAGFNIAMRPSIGQSNTDRDVLEGSTDTPKGATL